MQLREHPLMTYHRVPNWPPVWVQSLSLPENKKVRGELGTLKEVVYRRLDARPRCYLVIEYQNENYVGTLLFDDPAFCYLVAKTLRNRIGWSIKALGDLDLSHTL